MTPNYSQTLEKLSAIGQQHLLAHWKKLSFSKQHSLLQQIDLLKLDTFKTLQDMILQKKGPLESIDIEAIAPFTDFSFSGNHSDAEEGKKLMAANQCGTLIMAGGQGTRLRFDGPKGMFPVSKIKNKSLFQLFAEKTAAASKQAGCLLPIAIMTSPLNHKMTLNFFEEHHHFGLDLQQISFFSQSMLPFLDENGNLFLEEIDKIAEGPDGNGSSLMHFVESGLWDRWNAQGVRYVNFVLIDNPLADPFDAELIGYHHHSQCDVTVKCCLRIDPAENVGILVKKNNALHVVEYTEMPKSEQTATLATGELKHACANLSLFCFSMDHIKLLAENNKKMPLHLAHKGVKTIGKELMAWKFEQFIFDVLPMSNKVEALIYPREFCFSPLKNEEGPNSVAAVQEALQNLDRITIEKITGIKPSKRVFELAQEFYYPTPELFAHWKDKNLPPQDYIEAND